jgi:hypothetical protein
MPYMQRFCILATFLSLLGSCVSYKRPASYYQPSKPIECFCDENDM